MKNEADRLLEDLDDIRSNSGTTGPGHPKVNKWVGEVRNLLTHEGNRKKLKRFEHLEFVKGGSEMWSQDVISPGNVKKFKAELETIERILKEMAGPSEATSEGSADQKMRELFLTSDDEEANEEAQEETPEEILLDTEVETPTESTDKGKEEIIEEESLNLEKTMDQKIDPNFEAVTKQHLSASARTQTIDQLMGELNSEMKSADPDWNKIQDVMGGLMGLKKTGELLDQLKGEVSKRGAKWETVRPIMAELWSIKKDIIIDLLPTLLKA